LLVAWTRLILPDGRSLKLPGLASKDLAGQTGAQGDVDTHWQRVFGKALLLSAISAGAQVSQPQQTSAFAAPSARSSRAWPSRSSGAGSTCRPRSPSARASRSTSS